LYSILYFVTVGRAGALFVKQNVLNDIFLVFTICASTCSSSSSLVCPFDFGTARYTYVPKSLGHSILGDEVLKDVHLRCRPGSSSRGEKLPCEAFFVSACLQFSNAPHFQLLRKNCPRNFWFRRCLNG
jgi:hypothetical protein